MAHSIRRDLYVAVLIISSVMAVIGSSIGSAASIYILVAITGYLTFGNKVVGDIVLMCKRILCLRGLSII